MIVPGPGGSAGSKVSRRRASSPAALAADSGRVSACSTAACVIPAPDSTLVSHSGPIASIHELSCARDAGVIGV